MTQVCSSTGRVTALVTFGVLASVTQAHADNVGSPGDSWNHPVFAVLLALTIAAIIVIVFFPEVLPEILWAVEEEGTEAAVAEEEALAAERLQSIVDQVNPLGEGADQNCAWCAREVNEALGDMFAGETPQPYAPPWSQPGMAPPGADIARTMELVNEYGGLQAQSIEQIAQIVQNAGNGARGFVIAGNHVFNVVNYGGQVFFLDGQWATVLAGVPDIPGIIGFIPSAGF